MINLYPHQQKLIAEARAAYGDGKKRVLLQAATGAGKSIMASSIVRGAVDKNNAVWFVVPRIQLMQQMSTTFGSFGISHGYVADGYLLGMDLVKICTLQTLLNRIGSINPPRLIVIDETHWGGESVDELIKYAISIGALVLGLSATPARSDNFGMGDWYETMVTGPSVRWLIDNNYLSKYKLIRPDEKNKRGTQVTNHVESWKKHAEGRKTIIYCREVAHSKKIVGDFAEQGVRIAHMDATTQDEDRRRIINALADGEIEAITNVFLLTFGFDLASQVNRAVNIRCILDLASTDSLTSQCQKWGRALRYDPAGEAVIIDLAGNSHPEAHGFPCSPRDWVLDTSDVHRRDVESREALIRTIMCKKCFFPSRIGPPCCPNCKAPFEVDGKKIRIIDGELVEFTPEQIKAEEETERKDKRMEVGMAKTMGDLLRIEKERGYKSGWAFRQAKFKGIL